MFRPLTRAQVTLDVVVATVFGVLAAVMTILPWSGTMPGSAQVDDRVALVVAILLTVLFAAAAALYRLAPALALIVSWTAAVVQMLAGLPPLPANLAIFTVLFAAAAYGSRRLFWIGFASALLGAATIAAYLIAPSLVGAPLSGGASATVFLAIMTFVAAAFALLLSWTIGALVRASIRSRESRRATEIAEAAAAAEAERSRIARDMHDVVAHSLAVVIAQADGARYAAAADPHAAAAALGTIAATARSALADVRMLLTQLRHTQAAGPQPTLADLEGLYAQVRAAGVEVAVDVDPAPPAEVPAAVQLAIYRIAQEALTNALRHGTGQVEVALAWHPERVELTVRNAVASADRTDTAGATGHAGQAEQAGQAGQAGHHAEPSADDIRGHGLIGMRERAQLVGGRLDATREGGWFLVRAVLPVVS